MTDKMERKDQENEDTEDPVLSMVDYLKEEADLEEDAAAVLGDSDANQCTFDLGYKGRQALYACSTCKTVDDVPAAICLGCSYACHDGHDLYELYTKRNVRCDCGNKKFNDLTCKLCPVKEDYNKENGYNQNYKGLYCICSRPYPDPEDEIEDEMIQCVICEDWLHGRHLGAKKPPKSYSEMICLSCMSKHEFLWAYAIASNEELVVTSDSSSSTVDVEKDKSNTESDPADNSKTETNASQSSSETSTDTIKDVKEKQQATDDKQDKPQGSQSADQGSSCLLEDLRKRESLPGDSAMFWSEGYRSKFCTCNNCKSMYKEQRVSFLLDESDTVTAYEKRGIEKKGPSSNQDEERRVLQGMNHMQQIEMVQGFNDLKSALSDYLRHFAENGKVVREEDIREFFSQMQARKRQKTDHTPGYFCR